MNTENITLSDQEMEDIKTMVQKNMARIVEKSREALEDKLEAEPLETRLENYLQSLAEKGEDLHISLEYKEFLPGVLNS